MKIAILGSTLWTAPSQKGKIHAPIKLTYDLAKGLVKRGHQIVYFGLVTEREKNNHIPNLTVNDSYCKIIPNINDKEKNFRVILESCFFSKILKKEAEKFDLIYTHIYLIGQFAQFIDKPIVFTHHDSTRVSDYEEIFQSFRRPNLSIIPVSKYLPTLYTDKSLFLPAVLNGTGVDLFEPVSQNYFAWAGRIAKPKGLHIAIELAKKHHFKLKFAGPGGDHGGLGNSSEYSQIINNLMEGEKNIEYLRTLSLSKTHEMISKAKALIFPTDGTESFSMVVAESMCMGTPVIALNNGPMSELIADGVTGILCEDINEMEQALGKIDKIDRAECRKVAKEKLSVSNMVDGYEKAFLDLIDRHSRI